jgi:hypothetical protein
MDARPDRMDIRDLPYRPPLRSLPPQYPSDANVQAYLTGYVRAGMILDQGEEGACTGFGLAAVVNYLIWVGSGAKGKVPLASARMLYEMAKRYDEWPGQDYEGSSCRGALKGWHKHGVCAADLWPHKLDKNGKPVYVEPSKGWDADAAARPLGVYYRIDRRSVVDVQAAIRDIGAVYVSADVHDGWDELVLKRPSQALPTHASLPVIPPPKNPNDLGGHAFALVGYNERGFVVQNSWGPVWGLGGFGVLPYDDWVEHGTDAWAVGLGVPVQLPATSTSARAGAASSWPMTGRSLTSLDRSARSPHNPPDDPWPIDHPYECEEYEPWTTAQAYAHTLVSGNDGVLCVSDVTADRGNPGAYAKAIAFDAPLAATRGKVLKLMVYAHGGLNAESESIERIRVLAPYFEANGIYPLFLTWRTGAGETICDLAQDWARKLFGEAAPAGDIADAIGEARDRAVEAIAHGLGRGIWSEMRDNAALGAESTHALDLLARNLYALAAELKKRGQSLELHFVGHSAGSILLGHLITRMRQPDLVNPKLLTVKTCTLYAAACSVRFAVEHYLPADADLLDTARLTLYVLSDQNERADGLPNPRAPAYGKSLLYLVSRALDDRRKMPLLGMERALAVAYANDTDQWDAGELAQVQAWQKGSRHKEVIVADRDVPVTKEGKMIQATHGSFDNNIDAITKTILRVSGKSSIRPVEWLDY